MAQANDYSLSREVTNHLFQGMLIGDNTKKHRCQYFKLSEPGKDYGLDLASLNIQRGREFGTPSYNRCRKNIQAVNLSKKLNMQYIGSAIYFPCVVQKHPVSGGESGAD